METILFYHHIKKIMRIILKEDPFPSFEPTVWMKKNTQTAKGNYREDWLSSIGNKLFVFKGHGGTGKTVRLLKLRKNS